MTSLYDAYLYHRQQRRTPAAALTKAREDVATNKQRYPSRALGVAGGSTGDVVRWIEDTSAVGLRFVGHADEINGWIRHNGWFTDSTFNDEKYRGAVWQLPGRNNSPRFVGGYSDPNNEGAARIDLTIHDDKIEAARAGDSLAETDAERQRDYQAAWRAGSVAARNLEDAKAELQAAIELVADMRHERRAGNEASDTICRALWRTINTHRATAHKYLRNRAEIVDAYSATWREDDLHAAFAEGAEI